MHREQRTIFHIDMDAFFASVEQRDFPHYRNKPVIVGAKKGSRGVVSAASYEARAFGIHSAMPINEAYRRCPSGIYVQPRMAVYEAVSSQLITILSSFSPLIEQVSVDEAFIDMTGSGRLFGSPAEAAGKIAVALRRELNLTASIGIAPNKFCAKIASDMNKPCGITNCPVNEAEIIKWLAPMPVGKMWGVGKKTVSVLHRRGIVTIGDLQKLSRNLCAKLFGNSGDRLYYLSRGIDSGPVVYGSHQKSLSREHTFESDCGNRNEWQSIVYALVQDVSRRARKGGVRGSTIFITYRLSDFTRHTRQKPLVPQTNAAKYIFEEAMALLCGVHEDTLRLIGVGITGFDPAVQTDLFERSAGMLKWENSEVACDNITGRFGTAVLKKGRELTIPVKRKQKEQSV